MPDDLPAATIPDVDELLTVCVDALGGSPREGQRTMATAVDTAIATGEHLAVQAGTGTGKSLAYLVPSTRHAVATGGTVVVSTATIALQRQLVGRDLPRLADALEPVLSRRPTYAILKGRSNYVCLHKLYSGPEDDPDDQLFDEFAVSRIGREVTRLREWAQDTETGDRDDVVPGVDDRSWRQVSVTARECLGSARCPVASECFAELARAEAGRSDVVVTNHALLAIGAITGAQVLPEHDVVVIDEAHELVDRVTGVATEELTGAGIALAARRGAKHADQESADRLLEVGESWAALVESLPEGRWDVIPRGTAPALAAIRDAAWSLRTAVGPPKPGIEVEESAARTQALGMIEEVHDAAVRVLTAFEESDPSKRRDVVWLSEEERRGRVLYMAPLSVGGLLRTKLFDESTVVLTSATLTVGGSFDGLAVEWGLPAASSARVDTSTATALEAPADSTPVRWTGLDVGSPFEHRRAGILYIARALPPPSRDGIGDAQFDEIEKLIRAAGGRTLGLFSSRRAAQLAAAEMRERLDVPVLCQGDDSIGRLVETFTEDPATCLFGTLTLWQGVDVPGPSLSCVIIDKIPFPRPDDALLSARQRAVDARGGNGFMAVAASHAALLLAQGVGRLLRSTSDRGVVAILDPRLATARYGSYLRASLPDFWQTTDSETARAALARLVADADATGA